MKIFRYISLLILSITAFRVDGQQLGLVNQYFHNPYVFNPAIAGKSNDLNVYMSFRKQWLGVENAPVTSYISATKAFSKKEAVNYMRSGLRVSQPDRYQKIMEMSVVKFKHGVGGMVIQEKYGIFQKTAAQLSYALHYKIGKSTYIAAATAFSTYKLKIRADKLLLADNNDASFNYLIAQNNNTTFFDLNTGILLYNKELTVGYSAYELLQNKIKTGDATNSTTPIMHFIMANYKIKFKNSISLYPGTLIRFMNPNPLSWDANLKIDYMNKFWGGVSFRSDRAISTFLGAKILKNFQFGYTYERLTSSLSTYSTGSHEVVIGLTF